MRVLLFGGANKGSEVLTELLKLGEEVVGVFYFDVDPHEKVWYRRVEDIAAEREIPSFKYGTVGGSDTCQILKNLNPEIILVVGWRYLIPKEQYSIPPKGCIIFHDSLLPKYRGFAPMNWAIINGEKETGVTMFYVSDEVDAGDIIAQKVVAIDEMDDAKTLEGKLTRVYLELLEENLPLIRSDKVVSTPQDHSHATYTCKRTPEDGLIDWTKSAREIYNLIRGLAEPYPGAFTFVWDGQRARKLYIWSASVDKTKTEWVGSIPGRVIEVVKNEGVKVMTGSGVLLVKEVQFAGERKVRADEVLRSVKTRLGVALYDLVQILVQ